MNIDQSITLPADFQDILIGGGFKKRLSRINKISTEEAVFLAHFARIVVLLDQLDRWEYANMSSESLTWLEAQPHPPAQLDELITSLAARIEALIDGARRAFLEKYSFTHLITYDHLIPLAERFPVIYLSRGILLLDLHCHKGNMEADVYLRTRRSYEGYRSEARGSDRPAISGQWIERPGWGNAFTLEWKAFYENILNNRIPKTSPEDFRQDLELFMAVINLMR